MRLGLRANWQQFALLVVVNVFVGGMVGLERTTTSLVGTRVFHLSGYVAVFSFIIAFGVTKALTEPGGGPADRPAHPQDPAGRRAGPSACRSRSCSPGPRRGDGSSPRTLCLGVNQGLTSSMVVNMKIDLVGPRGRGLAMGLNEAAGYMAVGVTALATGYLAEAYGLRPVPELIGVVYAVAGLVLSAPVVRDTAGHVAVEAAAAGQGVAQASLTTAPRAPGHPAAGLPLPRRSASAASLTISAAQDQRGHPGHHLDGQSGQWAGAVGRQVAGRQRGNAGLATYPVAESGPSPGHMAELADDLLLRIPRPSTRQGPHPTPRHTFAATIHPHAGAQASRQRGPQADPRGPALTTGLCGCAGRSKAAPPGWAASALVTPNAMMKATAT